MYFIYALFIESFISLRCDDMDLEHFVDNIFYFYFFNITISTLKLMIKLLYNNLKQFQKTIR